MPIVDFITGSYKHKSINVCPVFTQNWYVESIETGSAKSRKVLIQTPGKRLFADATTTNAGNGRGNWFSSTSILYSVLGDILYSVDAGGVLTEIGAIGNTGGPVSMTDNGKYLFMADGISFFYHEMGSATINDVDLTSTDLQKPTQIVYVNSRIVAIDGSNKFYWSDPGLEGGLVWGGLSFASAEKSADPIIAIEKRQSDIWLFGDRSYEVHVGTGDADFVFVYRDGSSSDIGCGAPQSTSTIESRIFWLGSSSAGQNIIFMSDGFNGIRVSDHAVEAELDKISTAEFTNTTDAIGSTYQQNGHTFYVITFLGGNKTAVYDMKENAWHWRTTREPNLNIQNHWDALYFMYAYDKVVVGSTSGARLYTLDLDKYDEWDETPIVREHIGPIWWDSYKEIVMDFLTIDMETGVGLISGQGVDPLASVAISHDSGHTFSSELTDSLGKAGQYSAQPTWRGLGMGRNVVARLRVSDPVKAVVIGARVISRPTMNP